MTTRLLVVDDEPGIRDMLTWVLVERGFDVRAASDGRDGLAKLGTSEFDVMVCDVRMPEMSGTELLRVARQVAPDMEVIMATGFAELSTAVECLRQGAFDFLFKPLDLEQLFITIGRAVERRTLRSSAALYRASAAIFAPPEPSRLPQTIVEVVVPLMSAVRASLYLPSGEGALHLACAHPADPGTPSQEVVAAMEAREPVLLAARRTIVYPLTLGGHVLGVLRIDRGADGRPYSSEDVERAAILAAQVALALENRRMVAQFVTSERLATIGQLAASVGHELNNPVAAVLANLDFMGMAARRLREVVPEGTLVDLEESIAEAQHAGDRVRDIAKDLRTLARRASGSAGRIDLNDVVRSALRIVAGRLRRTALVVDLGEDVATLAEAGPLSQVFVNLLANAADAVDDAASPSKAVRVSTRRVADRVIATVADGGVGIAPENLDRIFETFFTTKPADRGTGLGLPISRDIVRAHDGELRVASAPGRGATFTIDLPVAPME